MTQMDCCVAMDLLVKTNESLWNTDYLQLFINIKYSIDYFFEIIIYG